MLGRKKQGDYRRVALYLFPQGWGSPSEKQVRRWCKKWFSKAEIEVVFDLPSPHLCFYAEDRQLAETIREFFSGKGIVVEILSGTAMIGADGRAKRAKHICKACGPVDHIYRDDPFEEGGGWICDECDGREIIHAPNKHSDNKEINAYVKAFRKLAA